MAVGSHLTWVEINRAVVILHGFGDISTLGVSNTTVEMSLSMTRVQFNRPVEIGNRPLYFTFAPVGIARLW